MPVNVRLVGDTVSEAAATVRVTLAVLVVPPPVTVMVALLVPRAALRRLMLAVMVPLPEPEVGLTVSHDVLLLAVQLPFDVTVTDWLGGLDPPWTPEYVSDVGLNVMEVGGGATVNVTGTETLVAPVALRVMVALYVPAVRVPVATLAVSVPLPVPEDGLTVSQVALSVADQLSVPPPVLLMFML